MELFTMSAVQDLEMELFTMSAVQDLEMELFTMHIMQLPADAGADEVHSQRGLLPPVDIRVRGRDERAGDP
jgi:hypothetical protein